MADTGNDALDAITRRQNLAIDSTVAWFERELRAVLNRAQMLLLADLNKRLTVVDGRIVPNAANQRVLREIDRRFGAAMRKAGYDELRAELAKGFGGQFQYFEAVLDVLGEAPVRWDARQRALFVGQQEAVLGTLEGIIQNVASVARQQALFSIGGLDVDRLAEIITIQTGKTIGQSTAVADTAQAAFYRTIADEGFRKIEDRRGKDAPSVTYRYYGPDDKLNRPFCRHILDAQQDKQRQWTRAEIEAMDNGQLPNPFVTGGGYRCRHWWILAVAVPDAQSHKAPTAAGRNTDLVKPLEVALTQGEAIDDERVQGRAKNRIVKDLARRLRGNASFDDLVYGRFRDLEIDTARARTAHEGAVDRMIKTWADGYDTPETPGLLLAMQEAARHEFGLKNWRGFDARPKAERLAARALMKEYGDGLRAFHRAQYESTQEWFRERGITNVFAFRGLKEVPRALPINESGFGKAEVALQPVSSFSSNFYTALGFATEQGGAGAMLAAEIPVGRILSTSRTGFGALGELEVTVLSGSGEMWAAWWRYESTLADEADLLNKIGKR